MLEGIIGRVVAFTTSSDYWFYHGWGLTILWVVFAFFGLLIRKVLRGQWSKWIHIGVFILVDYTSLFLELTALYRVWPRIAGGTFVEWPILKTAHVAFGLVACLWSISQHTLGIALHYFGKCKWQHISSGKLLFMLARIVAVVGWIITKKYQ